MRVTILGAGPAGSAMAALCALRGHTVTLWSPRGGGTRHLGHELETRGVLEGRWRVQVAADLWRAAEQAEAIIIALPGAAMPAILQRLASALVGELPILFAPAGALAPALLHQFTSARGVAAPIGALPVPPILARRDPDGVVAISAIRPRLWLAALPVEALEDLLLATQALFGLPVEPLSDMLAASLAEPGAIFGAAQFFAPAGVQHGLGRLLLGLTAERDALAHAVGRQGLPGIAELVTEQGGLPDPPRPLSEIGAGLAFLQAMGVTSETPTPLITAALQLLEAATGEGFGPHPVLATLDRDVLARIF